MIPNSYEAGQKLKSRWKISFSQKGSENHYSQHHK